MGSSILKYSGMMGIAVLWISVGLSLYITRFDVLGLRPISYLGVYSDSKYLFNSGLILASLLLILFLYYLSTQLRLSKPFIFFFTLGQVCQIIVALTPFNAASVIRPIHVVAGFLLAVTLPTTIWLFTRFPELSVQLKELSKRFFYAEIILFVLGISWFVFASTAGALSEILTAVAFDVWIVAISLQLCRS